MFNKKEEQKKTKKDQTDKLHAWMKYQNQEIEQNDISLDKESRKLADKFLAKKQMEVVMQCKQDNNKVHIDINIAESRIKDLEGLKEMTMTQLKDIITEKRKVDKENFDLDVKIQGKGISEVEAKAKQLDGELEQIIKIRNSLKF